MLTRLTSLVLAERACSADVIEHLLEIDRRKLYASQACGSLSSNCIERLGYSEDDAGKRVRVARLARQFPGVLDELRSGAIHLTGLYLLARHITQENCALLLAEARDQSRRQIEQLIARRFPTPDIPDQICPLAEQLSAPALTGSEQAGSTTDAGPTIRPRTDPASQAPGRLKALSATSFSVQFTASAVLREKIERALGLVSHALPRGDLAALFERALDELIEKEMKRRLGAEKPRKRRQLSPGSRHVPVDIARLVWERDGGQCTFVDEQGRRCSARRFVQIEHRHPHALGGPATSENLCLLCATHNAHAARKVFGQAHIDAKIEARRLEREKRSQAEIEANGCYEKVRGALCRMGFAQPQVRRTLSELRRTGASAEPEPLLRAALGMLVP